MQEGQRTGILRPQTRVILSESVRIHLAIYSKIGMLLSIELRHFHSSMVCQQAGVQEAGGKHGRDS